MNDGEIGRGIVDGIVTVAQDMRSRVAYLVKALVITFLTRNLPSSLHILVLIGQTKVVQAPMVLAQRTRI